MQMSVLAQNIEQRKRDLGIAKSIDLAKKSSVSRAVLTNIRVNPEKDVTLSVGVKLAKALDCRLDWLATGEGAPNLDAYLEASKTELGAPVVTLNELVNTEPHELIEKLRELDRERHPCPTGNSKSQIIVKSNRKVFDYPAGYFYFDIDKTPVSGQLVIANTGGNAEIMEYQSTHGRQFLKSLEEDLPPDLRFIEITDQKLIGTFEAFAIF